MEKLRLRCPTCAKLYEVNRRDILSHSPQFDCVSCATRFMIDLQSPLDEQGEVLTQVVFKDFDQELGLQMQKDLESESFAALQGAISSQKKSISSCPKCGAARETKSSECYSCHVIFDRLEELPMDPSLKAQPSLIRKWKQLVLNFDNRALHDEFLKSCRELEALRFAILKYEELRKAQGGRDDICQSMITKAQSMLDVTLSARALSRTREESASLKSIVGWHKFVFLVPLSISILMILIGFFSLSLRNLVGAGVAMVLLTFGLVLFWKGRISLSDFI